MAYTVAVVSIPDIAPSEAAAARCAFEAAGHTVQTVVADEEIAGTLLKLNPDVAYIAVPRNGGETQMLLEALGIPYIGSTPNTLRKLSFAGSLAETLQAAADFGEIEQGMPASLVLSAACVESLLRAGATDTLQKTLGCGYPLNVTASYPYTRSIVARVDDAEGLESALRGMAGTDVLVEEAVEGLEVLVGIMGDLDNILILPPFTYPECERVALSDLSQDESDAQAIRSEIERTALDAFILSGCRDAATVHLVWDGGRARILNVNPSPALEGYLGDALEAAQTPLSEILDELAANAVARA